jgi:hypothetical protein
MGLVWDLTRNVWETADKWQFALQWRSDMLQMIDKYRIAGTAMMSELSPVGLFDTSREVMDWRRPIEIISVDLENGLDMDEEKDVVGIYLSTYVTYGGRELGAPGERGVPE